MLSRLMTRREQLILVFLAGAMLLGAIVFYLTQSRRDDAQEVVVEPAQPAQPESQANAPGSGVEAGGPIHQAVSEAPEEVIVSVVGEIFQPGVYTLQKGSRVNDLIWAGGGLRAFADTSDINLAAKLVDGTTLTVPRKGAASRSDESAPDEDSETAEVRNPRAYTISGSPAAMATAGATGQRASSGGLINLNRASQAELESLPGIGPKLAGEIIRYRQQRSFARIIDLMEVSGIGPKRYEAVRDLITVN